MANSMATTKIAVTLPDQQLRDIRALVAAGQSGSISAFVKHAVDIALFDAAGWQEMLAGALQQTGGPLTNKERGWADSIPSPRQAKRRSPKPKAA